MYQEGVDGWMKVCFDEEVRTNVEERGDRLLEEVLELLQSKGYDRTRVSNLTEYVFNRPPGEPYQEVGGVMVTLAAYCTSVGIDMEQAGADELKRIWDKVPEIQAKQLKKRLIHAGIG